MNKLKTLMKLIILFILGCSINVSAAGANVSVSSNNVYVGDSFKVFVNIIQAAAWNIHVNASGPVTGCAIHEVDSTSNALNTSKQFSAKCNTTREGKISINLSGDVTSAPSGNYLNVSGSAIVNVVKRPPSLNTNNNTSYVNSNIEKSNNKSNKEKSKNCDLKSISVDGYKLEKVDANNYTLIVPNTVKNINVNATAVDNKATVTGTGNHELKTGDNSIEIVITSESGKKNNIVLKVTRKTELGLDEIDELLKTDKRKIEININSNDKLSSQQLSKIKNSGKKVILNHKENGIINYSWIIDGNKISDFDELLTEVKFSSKNRKKISKLTNYAEGIYLSFKQKSDFPDGIKLKVYVKNKYVNGSKVNVYYYDNKKIILHRKNLIVKDGYIIFDIDKNYDHFITMSKLQLSSKNKGKEDQNLLIPILVFFVGLISIVSTIIFVIKKNKKQFN